jgi:hypothetical protein
MNKTEGFRAIPSPLLLSILQKGNVMIACQNPMGEVSENKSTAWAKVYVDETIDYKPSKQHFDVDDEELHGGLVKEYPIFSVEGVEALAGEGINDKWFVGAMSDCIYIINTRPRPSNDDIWHERTDGPTMSVPVANLTIKEAQFICDVHNSSLSSPHPSVTQPESNLPKG